MQKFLREKRGQARLRFRVTVNQLCYNRPDCHFQNELIYPHPLQDEFWSVVQYDVFP